MAEREIRSAPRDAALSETLDDRLVSWFRESGRDLPWRRTRDPWRVLVSEVMLQQIQVRRAIPFYERFVARFPTVEALAGAPIAEAIKAWGDLGRYRRVVNLHRTARILVEQHGGKVPSDPEVLVKLPGIGPYTAGAAACFAYERDVAFADTNMRRVMHRLFFGPELPEPRASERELLELAAGLVPPGGGWEWNQALMELGALLCTARKPACEGCPLRELCRARPVIGEVLAGKPRPAKTGTVYRYEGTNRYHRGRVLARLREAPAGGIPIGELGVAVRDGFTDGDLPWLYGVIESLQKDGLAVIAGQRDAPGPTDAVAEERAAYGTGRRDGGGTPDEPRVRLP